MLKTLAQSPHYASRQNKTEWNEGHVSYTEKPGRWNETFWFLNMEYHHFRNRFGSAYQIWLSFQLEPFMKKSYLFDCVCVFVFSENHFFIIVLTYQMFVARSTMCSNCTMVFHSHFFWICMGWQKTHHTTPHHTIPQDLILQTQSFTQNIYTHTGATSSGRVVERKLYSDASFKSQTTKNESSLKWRTMSSARRSCTRTKSHAKPHTFT